MALFWSMGMIYTCFDLDLNIFMNIYIFPFFNQVQPAPHMPSLVGTSTASLLDGAVMGMMTVVMDPMRITAQPVVQPPAHLTSLLAPMETASRKHGSVMPLMTVGMVLMRDIAVSIEEEVLETEV